MRMRSAIFLVVLSLGISAAVTDGKSQNRVVAIKNGESVELHTVYWVSNCRSIMIGLPVIEILEGPPQVSLSMKADKVVPRRQECANAVPGGILIATAKDVTEPVDAKLTYRLKYRIKDGERPRGYTIRVSLFP